MPRPLPAWELSSADKVLLIPGPGSSPCGSLLGSVSARASKYRCAELKPVVTQAASKMPSTATVLRRSQPSSARAVARDLTEPPVVTQAASKMPSTATVLRRSQPSSARAVARDLTEPNNSPEIANELRQNRAVPPETMRTETARVEQAAHEEAQVAATILAHGAKRLVVFELPDLGILPWFHSEAAQNYVRELSAAYNRRLIADLPQDPAILVLHTQAFFDDLFTRADRYGLTHLAHEDACREEDQDYCYPNSLKSAGADRTFVFAAGEHMTTRTNELLAEYVLRQVEASPIR